MQKCAFDESNIDSRRKLTNSLVKTTVNRTPVAIDKRRYSPKHFKGELDLGWLTRK